MEFYKKFNIKVIIYFSIVFLAVATCLFGCKLFFDKIAKFSMPMNFSENEEISDFAFLENQNIEYTSVKYENTETEIYIYTVDDFVAFRDDVNNGNNYEGKTVYLMNDLDLSTVCSSSIGTWLPIGYTTTYPFSGTFDGKFHTISNLYLNNTVYANVGLFANVTAKGIVKDFYVKNPYIYNAYTAYSRTAVVALNYGSIQRIGVIGGTIEGYQTATATAYKAVVVGSIVGYNYGTVTSCYNTATIKGTANTSNSNCQVRMGGVVGINYDGTINGCYNKGKVIASAYSLFTGGVVGAQYGNTNAGGIAKITNCYNVGAVTIGTNKYNRVGGILGCNGDGTNSVGTISNSFCSTGTTYSYYTRAIGVSYANSTTSTTGRVAADTIKTYSASLGNLFAYDAYNQNAGYPVCSWQNNEKTVLRLNYYQDYIKIGENKNYNVLKSEKACELLGDDFVASDFVWQSSNSDVASVDINGNVIGLSEGYTTILAYHADTNKYAMMLVNVAKDFATPQVETGNRFTVILKSNGDVYTTGNNSKGQLGIGTLVSSKEVVKVKKSDGSYLEKVIKIAVGSNHVLALTSDGKVYAWGDNSVGQLGNNTTEDSSYATLVMNSTNTDCLSNIIDISANALGSCALTTSGTVYVWGNGSYGEIGNSTTTSYQLPVASQFVKDGIKIEMGIGNIGVLSSEGAIWSWGRNNVGQCGINCKVNNKYPMKSGLNFLDISIGAYHNYLRKVDNTFWTSGSYVDGRLGVELTDHQIVRINVTMPSVVTVDNPVKYAFALRDNTMLLLKDGSVLICGLNVVGEMGVGNITDYKTSASFLQVLTARDTPLENAMILGRSIGIEISETGYGVGLHNTVITKDGEIYIAGILENGQGSNNKTEKSLYFTKMGYRELLYEDKEVSVTTESYQIDKNKLSYRYIVSNVYDNYENLAISDLSYSNNKEENATVNESGLVTPKKNGRGRSVITITDIVNGYSTSVAVLVNGLSDTSSTIYIYDEYDLDNFRKSVSSGKNCSEMTVYLMSNIDMKNICSSTVGSWKTIGNGIWFAGTFDGQNHTISNLYINSSDIQLCGLFFGISATGVVKNLMLNNAVVTNTYSTGNSYSGGISGRLFGKIINCGVNSGNINTSQSVIGTSDSIRMSYAGGIVGQASTNSVIEGCYNKATVKGTANTTSNYSQARVGGIAGALYLGKIISCYNSATVQGYAYHSNVGGIASVVEGNSDTKAIVQNCYNYGAISCTYSSASNKHVGAIAGRNCTGTPLVVSGTISNCYYLDNMTLSYKTYSTAWSNVTTGKLTSANLKANTVSLGNSFAYDVYNKNGGYPVLSWQNDTPVLNLNKNQVNIKVGEISKLSVLKNDKMIEFIGQDFSASQFEWKTTNKNIVEIDSNGQVIGVSEGSTTVYAYHASSGLYAMAIVNVSKDIAIAQVATGYKDTIILKSDGTVWSIGNNEYGNLGIGNTDLSKDLNQVKIDEESYLTDIIKIAVGSNHVLALSKSGIVYSWGYNARGELGIGLEMCSTGLSASETTKCLYAKPVLSVDKKGYLSNIVDIDVDLIGSAALDKDGNVYTWGSGLYGEANSSTYTNNNIPVKCNVSNGIKIELGSGSVSVLCSDGSIWSWGRNEYGELGINSTATKIYYKMKTSYNAVDVSRGTVHAMIRKVDNKFYYVGLTTNGRAGGVTTTNTSGKIYIYVQGALPQEITEENGIRQICASRQNSAIVYDDGSVWVCGTNGYGELGTGLTTAQTTYTKALTAADTPLTNVVYVGENVGGISTSAVNTVVILKDGSVFMTGNNDCYQMGDNTTVSSNYFKTFGYVSLEYEDKDIEIGSEGYQLDKNKLKYNYRTINVYGNNPKYEIGEIEFELYNRGFLNLDENGLLTPKIGACGSTDIIIKDKTNNMSTVLKVSLNKIESNENVLYIYNEDDLVAFRDSVNAGNNYKNKIVYLMADLNLSKICYKGKNFVPIGAGSKSFQGTFDGNYYTISNLYMDTSEYQRLGLFGTISTYAIVRNLQLKNIYVRNTYDIGNVSSFTGAVVGYSYGKIINCGVLSGSVISKQSQAGISKEKNACVTIGGITGIAYNSASLVSGCFNKASVSGTSATTKGIFSQSRVGGIVGTVSNPTTQTSGDRATVEDCYNVGKISSYGDYNQSAGIVCVVGHRGYIRNCYNYGQVVVTTGVSTYYRGGIAARNGQGVANTIGVSLGSITNSYCTSDTTNAPTLAYKQYNASTNKFVDVTTGRVTAATLKGYTAKLGGAFRNDNYTINSGYPILWWQEPTMSLSTNQEYIDVGESLQLDVIKDFNLESTFNIDMDNSNFTWTSTNNEIASVDQNGLVNGLKDGFTTIYAKHNSVNLYAICVVNVSKNVAFPQVESGNRFTVMLKADGTVWTVGSNEYGALGNGTDVDSMSPVQVMVNSNEPLTNVIKIAAGSNHVVALTENGKVYSWGDNTAGQLGHGNKIASKYAKEVISEDKNSSLSRIVDISAGGQTSTAINAFGWQYVWGNGTNGEIGNGSYDGAVFPVKASINNAVSVSAGNGHVVSLLKNACVATWGNNSKGQLGFGNTVKNKNTPGIKASTATEISAAGQATIVKIMAGNYMVAGKNENGELGVTTNKNLVSYTAVSVASFVSGTNKIKYIKASTSSILIMLTDGTVYVLGTNSNGELGNGTNNKIISSTKVMLENNQSLENAINIGRSNSVNGTLNTCIIDEMGRIYISGDNSSGQLGNNTKTSTNQYILMGYEKVLYPESVILQVGAFKTFKAEDFKHQKFNFNVYRDDIVEKSLVESTRIVDSSVVSYQVNNVATSIIGQLTGLKEGYTILAVRDNDTKTFINIPVSVVNDEKDTSASVSVGKDFTITLKKDKTVWSYGTNVYGELGIGDRNYRNYPVKIAENMIQISTGLSHTIALSDDGKVYAWGLNSSGQIGNGSKINVDIPTEISIPVDNDEFAVVKEFVVKVFAIDNLSYVISSLGKVYVWGNGNSKPKELVITNNINDDMICAVDISKNYLLNSDGNLYSLNILSNINYELKQKLEIMDTIEHISESNTHAVFLASDKTAYAIGKNQFGQLANGMFSDSLDEIVAVRNSDLSDILRNIVDIKAGDGYTVAISSDGLVYVAGTNRNYQFGLEDETIESNKLIVNEEFKKIKNQNDANGIMVSVGNNHIAVVLENGFVYSWGQGEEGQLGNGTNEKSIFPVRAGKNVIFTNSNNLLLTINETYLLESEITYFNLFELIKGEITYESRNLDIISVESDTGLVTANKSGVGTVVIREKGTSNIGVVKVQVLLDNAVSMPMVDTKGSHTVSLKADGSVWSYGLNSSGQLGNGSFEYSDYPVQTIFPEGTVIREVAAGSNFSVALDKDGNVWTWGANEFCQLGLELNGKRNVPAKVDGISNIIKIAVGEYSVLVVDSNHDIWSWGLNSNGELGIGTYTNKIVTPTKAKFITDVIDVSVGKNHSLALKFTGEVCVTGLNMYGQLGNNDSNIKKTNLFTSVDDVYDVCSVEASDNGCFAITIYGKVLVWGLNIYGELGTEDKINKYEPVMLDYLNNVSQVSAGKNHTIILDSFGNIYSSGSNRFGQLGIGSNVDRCKFESVQDISDIMFVSAGNTYSVYANCNGSVWGFGDYNHGNNEYKSRTNSIVPMQVGNDVLGLDIDRLVIKKSEIKNLAAYINKSFNLIRIDNSVINEVFTSENDDIAKVNGNGDILGVNEGLTLVKVKYEDGKEQAVYVYVVDNDASCAPTLSGGKNFAQALKSDGSIWSWGHNNNGELGIGSIKTKDIPERTNIISSYNDIVSGESFTLALRDDGTVWAYGKNSYGQLGNGTVKNNLNPSQVGELKDIVKISAGKEHSLALDSYGILYSWGRNNFGQIGTSNDFELVPVKVGYTGGTIKSIYAGENQSVIIYTDGKIYGFGQLFNGFYNGVKNPVKVAIGTDYMLILSTDGLVYRYDGNSVNALSIVDVIDISVNVNKNIIKTANNMAYIGKDGESLLNASYYSAKVGGAVNFDNVYKVFAGINNYYIALTDGTVYANGLNEFGQLGNGTRSSSEEFVLVGDRRFSIVPESKIMFINDVEDVTAEIQGYEFNLFNKEIRKAEEYIWESSNGDIVEAENGILTALSLGVANITVTDTVTNEKVELLRVVEPLECDRIERITVNDEVAHISGENEYSVKVATIENIQTLMINTRDENDKISIDGGQTWFYYGKLRANIELLDRIGNVDIIVETSNGTQFNYALMIEKISNDARLSNIKVNGVDATAISAYEYEAMISDNSDFAQIIANTNSEFASISVNGMEFTLKEALQNVESDNFIPFKVPIIVRAENGMENEYVLTVYKQSVFLELNSLTVNGVKAEKTDSATYSIVIDRDISEAEICARANSESVNISIDNQNATHEVAMTIINISDEHTEVSIRTVIEINGVELINKYTLNIYKKAITGNIKYVMVNNVVIRPDENGIYEIMLPALNTKANVEVVAENELDFVQIDNSEKSLASILTQVDTLQDVNTYNIKIIDSDEIEKNYTLKITKPSVDTTVKSIEIRNGDYYVLATQNKIDACVFEAKVKYFDTYNISILTNNIYSFVGFKDEALVQNKVIKTINNTGNTMNIQFKVESENGDIQEYILNLYIMSADVELDYIDVISENGLSTIRAKLQPNGKYLAVLNSRERKVRVRAQTLNDNAFVSINYGEFNGKLSDEEIDIDSKETNVDVRAKAEDGTYKLYSLVISGLPDDATLEKIIVNGEEAKHIEGSNNYEIRMSSDEFVVKAIANDVLAEVAINDNDFIVGYNEITINKEGEKTIVNITVVAQDGIDIGKYVLEIKDKSSDCSLSGVVVNNKQVVKLENGDYRGVINGNVNEVDIKAYATDSYAKISIFDMNDNEYTTNRAFASCISNISDRTTRFKLKVVAEDGTTEENYLDIIRLNGDTGLEELKLSYEVNKSIIDEETGEESTSVEQVYIEIQDEGNDRYSAKIPRIDMINVEAITLDAVAMVKIENSDYVVHEVLRKINTISDETVVDIYVKAEDNTVKQHKLTLVKQSNNTNLKEVSSTEMLFEDNGNIYVNEKLTNIKVKFVTEDVNAKIKLHSENEYVLNEMIKDISITDDDIVFDEIESGWFIDVDVMSEDGTVKTHRITIEKVGNVNILSVKADGNVVSKVNDAYSARVHVETEAEVEITTEDVEATISLVKKTLQEAVIEPTDGDDVETQADEGETIDSEVIVETEILNGIGTIVGSVPLEEDSCEYWIKVISSGGNTAKEYKLTFDKMSQETGISYIKVNSLTAIENEDNSYTSIVSGKEKYPLIIKTVDANASVKYEYESYISNTYKGRLEESINVPEDMTIQIVVIVTAEDGNEQRYTLEVTRRNSNTALNYVMVNDELVTDYNSRNKTYTMVVDNALSDANINVKAVSEKTRINIGENSEVGELTMNVELDGEGTNKVVTVVTQAEDGSEDIYTIIIVQMSADVILDNIIVNNITAKKVDVYNYEVTISDVSGLVDIVATAGIDKSFVSIDNEDYQQWKSSCSLLDVVGYSEYIVPIKVRAEDGVTEQEYTLIITVLSSNANLEYVKVDGVNVTEYDLINKTFEFEVDNDLEFVSIEAKTEYNNSLISIGEESNTELISKIIDLEGAGNTTRIPITVVAEDGTSITYFVKIYQKSNNSNLKKVLVNDKEVSWDDEENAYVITVKDSDNLINVIAKSEIVTSVVSIDGSVSAQGSVNKNYDLEGHAIIQINIRVTAEDGTVSEYLLKVNVIETSAETLYVKVNNHEISKGDYYKAFVSFDSVQANIEIKAESEFATVEILNEDDLVINYEDNSSSANGILKFKVDTLEEKTLVKYRIISENGDVKENQIELTKVSLDTSLKEVYVDGVLINKADDGNYYLTIENEKDVVVKAVTNNEYAKVRINFNDPEIKQSIATINATGIVKIVFTITSQGETSSKEILYITVIENNTELDKVIVDSVEVTDFNENISKFKALVDNSKESYEIFLLAINSNASIELLENDEVIATGVGSLSDMIYISEVDAGKNYHIKVSLDEEHFKEYDLEVLRISNDVSLKFVEVNSVLRLPKPSDSRVFEVQIPALAESSTIKVETTNKFAKVQIADEEQVNNKQEVVVQLSLNEPRITVPVVVTAVDGETIETYNIILIRGSNDTRIELKVNDVVINKNLEGNYYAEIIDTDNSVQIEGTLLGQGVLGCAGTIDINDTGIFEENSKLVLLQEDDLLGKRIVSVPIVVIAEDGTRKDSVLEIKILSTNTQIDRIYINDLVEGSTLIRNCVYNEQSNIYEGKVRQLAENIDVCVVAKNQNSSIVRCDSLGNVINGAVSAKGELFDNVASAGNNTIVYFKVISEAGTTSEVYEVSIDKLSNNTNIDFIKIDKEYAIKKSKNSYVGYVRSSVDKALISIESLDESQNYFIDEVQGESRFIDVNSDSLEQVVKIKVVAEDGTVNSIDLTLYKMTSISGKILTENFENKHSSKITIYKHGDVTKTRIPVAEGITEEDGTFEFYVYITELSEKVDENSNGVADALERTYDVIISKDGYLDYVVFGVEVEEGKSTNIGEYKLIAGNVVVYNSGVEYDSNDENRKSEQIEIDDLTAMTEYIGIDITDVNRDKYGRFDLNEDGTIDSKDRAILKKNYGKIAFTEKWINPKYSYIYGRNGNLILRSINNQEVLKNLSKDDNSQDTNSNEYSEKELSKQELYIQNNS